MNHPKTLAGLIITRKSQSTPAKCDSHHSEFNYRQEACANDPGQNLSNLNSRGTQRRNSLVAPGKLRKVIKKCCQGNNSLNNIALGRNKCGSNENSRCINCYLRDGKAKKKAWACQHTDKLHYGKGMCGNCYHLAYYHRRRAQLTGTSSTSKKEPFSIEAVKVRSNQVPLQEVFTEEGSFPAQEKLSTLKDSLITEP